MVADGRAFGVSLGIYSAIAVGCLLFFGAFRKTRICKKFYAPKRYEEPTGLRNLHDTKVLLGCKTSVAAR